MGMLIILMQPIFQHEHPSMFEASSSIAQVYRHYYMDGLGDIFTKTFKTVNLECREEVFAST